MRDAILFPGADRCRICADGGAGAELRGRALGDAVIGVVIHGCRLRKEWLAAQLDKNFLHLRRKEITDVAGDALLLFQRFADSFDGLLHLGRILAC